MEIRCVWEHNGEDTLLYGADFPGAFTRGARLQTALDKMPGEVRSYLRWAGLPDLGQMVPVVVQEKATELQVRDADSDVLFDTERGTLEPEEYGRLKALALRSAQDFLKLYRQIPQRDESALPVRQTFYGAVPRTAREMYEHTKNVNSYYFAEIGVPADDQGSILDCRQRGFDQLERMPGYLDNAVQVGSYESAGP